MLPKIKEVNALPVFTPTLWQTLILRCYGVISNDRIAKTLRVSVETVIKEAEKLGLSKIKFEPEFRVRGYITPLRAVWNILPYSQIMTLLDMDEQTLDYNLKEDDFLDCKLGGFKPYCEEVVYSPLTEAQERETAKLRAIIEENFIDDYAPYFRFYDKAETFNKEPTDDIKKVAYSYSLAYGDTFLEGESVIDEGLLKNMKSVGVNGIWMQGVLSALSPYPFCPKKSEGYEKRRENLKRIVEKCARYGVGVYLYINEPRALDEELFTEDMEELKGGREGNNRCLCTSHERTQKYLYEAVRSLCESVPNLAGIITITMSENLTNCFSRGSKDCPVCLSRGREVVVPEVNNIIAKAVRDSGAKTEVIANLWAWTKGHGWSDEMIFRALDNLDKSVAVMSVSELGTVIRNGKSKTVSEYSLSQIGPCEETKRNLAYAKEKGHKVWAKVQINNSWEFSTVPYIPVFNLVMEHIEGLKKLDLSGLMLSWTLGGYPTVTCDLVSEMLKGEFDYDEWLKYTFGEEWQTIKSAVALFSEGFSVYPEGYEILYYGPQHVGATNLLYKERTGREASMVCYPYDDIDCWRGANRVEELTTRLETLVKKFREGLALLEGKLSVRGEELKLFASATAVSLESALNEARFIVEKEEKKRRKLLEREKELTLEHYEIASKDCRIGYEASNHYFYTQNSFLEKLINLEKLNESV